MLTGTFRLSALGFAGTAAREVCNRHCTCPGVATTGCTTQLRRRRLILAPCAASAADTPRSQGSLDPKKLPPLRRIRSPILSAEENAEQQTPADVDQDLWEVLDLCTIEELEELHGILFGATFLPRMRFADTGYERCRCQMRLLVQMCRQLTLLCKPLTSSSLLRDDRGQPPEPSGEENSHRQ